MYIHVCGHAGKLLCGCRYIYMYIVAIHCSYTLVENCQCLYFSQTIRVMDGKSFDIIRILSTYDLHGWHTLTYLTLHPSTSPHLLLTCTTQNGYVVVWNVRSGYRVTCGRIHCGSVEGLAWNKSTGSLATVGADCITHLFKVIIEHN